MSVSWVKKKKRITSGRKKRCRSENVRQVRRQNQKSKEGERAREEKWKVTCFKSWRKVCKGNIGIKSEGEVQDKWMGSLQKPWLWKWKVHTQGEVGIAIGTLGEEVERGFTADAHKGARERDEDDRDALVTLPIQINSSWPWSGLASWLSWDELDHISSAQCNFTTVTPYGLVRRHYCSGVHQACMPSIHYEELTAAAIARCYTTSPCRWALEL